MIPDTPRTLRLYLHAVRAARGRQLLGRVRRPLTRRVFPGGGPPQFAPPLSGSALWRSAAFEQPVLAGAGTERLRRFHEHYGDDVLALARAGRGRDALSAALDWATANPPARGDAWHPYPTSTRTANWIAACALVPEPAPAPLVDSLWRQLRHLSLNVEDDILGNHVIRNARALVGGGVSFGDAGLLGRGAAILRRELPEQVLADGGHYERSPVYHRVVLRDLLEIDVVHPGLVPRGALDRMRSFAAALTRPDGAPALFNDGGLDLAPKLELPGVPDGVVALRETGYAVVRRGGLWLAFDAGPPAPPFLPPHAHADGLSFQLWLDGRQVVPDPGTSTYEPGTVRLRERGTFGHATVSIDGRSQFEPWGAFRAGPFPSIEILDADETRLRGRVHWRGGVTHSRTVDLGDPDEVVIIDHVDGSGRHRVTSALPVLGAPDVRPIGPIELRREAGAYAERFFETRPCAVLVLDGEVDLPVVIGWRIRLRA